MRGRGGDASVRPRDGGAGARFHREEFSQGEAYHGACESGGGVEKTEIRMKKVVFVNAV